MNKYNSADEYSAATRQRAAYRGAFTLVELLVVLAIVLIVATLVLPSAGSALGGLQLNGAAGVFQSTLAQARQAALARSLPVEVRLYQVDDGTGLAWRMVGTVIPATAGASAVDEWINPPQMLAGGVQLANDAGKQFSTVLTGALPYQAGAPVAPWTKTEPASAILAVRNKPYVSFAYGPNGLTNLPEGSTWTLTLRGLHSKPLADAPAANYFSMVIDPRTGRALTYQP